MGPAAEVEITLRFFQTEMLDHLLVHTAIMVTDGHFVNRTHIGCADHVIDRNVAEQRYLAAFASRNILLATAQDHIGLDTDTLQFLDGMLGRLGLQLTRGFQVRHQRQVQEHGAFAPELVAQLANCFKKRQALDIADRAADFTKHKILVIDVAEREFLDRISHVRNHLDGRPQIIAAAFLFDHIRIDPPGRDVIRSTRRNAGKAFIMAEIQIGFGTVIGDVHLAMLGRAHGARIDVEIGVQFAQSHTIAARLKKRAEGSRGQPLAE